MQEWRAILHLKPENFALIGVDANPDSTLDAGIFGGGRIVGGAGRGDDGEGVAGLLREGRRGGTEENSDEDVKCESA